jgi:hypothetical protein
VADADWERRLELLWASLDDRDADEFVAAIDVLVGELAPARTISTTPSAPSWRWR